MVIQRVVEEAKSLIIKGRVEEANRAVYDKMT
jgi:adenylate cyclase